MAPLLSTHRSASPQARRLSIILLAIAVMIGGVRLGVGYSSSGREFEPSVRIGAGDVFQVEIEGDGYFQIIDSGRFQYTRTGLMELNADREIVVVFADGARILEPRITVPSDAVDLRFHRDGVVSVLQQGQTARTEIGMLQLARFERTSRLEHFEEVRFEANDAAGAPVIDSPGNVGLGWLRQRRLASAQDNHDGKTGQTSIEQ